MGIPTVRDNQNTDPASDDKTGENEVIWEITFAIYLSANPNVLLTCLLLWILWRYWILVDKFHFENSSA